MKKDKSKIKPFFKRRKKILKPILYTLAGVSLWLTTTIISIGGLTNFGERALFEYIIAHQESKNKDYCETYGGSVGAVSYAGYGGFKHYFHKAEIQFLDYYGEYRDLSDEETKKAESFLPFYKGDPEIQVQLAINFKNKSKYDFNHCTFTRLLLRAAHQNNEVAKKILTSYSYNMMGSYVFYDDDRPFFLSKDFYLFNKYIKKINSEKDLDNPALTHVYANNTGAGKRNKYYVQAAEEGHLLAMEDYLLDHDGERFKKEDCGLILKYNNYLADQLSLIYFFNVLHANMGKISSIMVRPYYKCLNEVTNFSKAYSMAVRIPDILSDGEDTNNSNRGQFWAAFMELNGLGTKQNYEKSFENFEICSFNKNQEIKANKCTLYLSYMYYKGLGVSKDSEKGLSIFINFIESKFVSEVSISDHIISCGGKKYDFKIADVKDESKDVEKNRRSQYTKKLVSCVRDASEANNIKSLEETIKTRMENWFKNPELVKTLNYLGEPK